MTLPLHLQERAAALTGLRERLGEMTLAEPFGTVVDVKGPLARVAAPDFRVGEMCEFLMPAGRALLGEVIGLQGDFTLVTPLGPIEGIGQGTMVRKRSEGFTIPFSSALLGRMVTGLGEVVGEPLDGPVKRVPVKAAPPEPADRAPIDTALPTGLRVIDGCMTLARGQRVAVIGPPGAGKSTLLAAITAHSDVDVVVFGLIGERGREIQEFVTRKIPDETRQKLVVVAAPADKPALERLYAANTATAIAEGFRDQGKSVLLVIDSMTRVARAMREVGLAAGEPPTRRGYPASVFAQLPELIERPGPAPVGEITAIYSVLAEGETSSDPIAEETRSLVDGHIILDASIAAGGRYPAINVTESLSRLMAEVVEGPHQRMNTAIRACLAKYAEIELLVQIGEYSAGQDPEADRALELYPYVQKFLKQGPEKHEFGETLEWMREMLE
ncbi:MAG: FliI/YscN family ATPase [Pseudomonadota bacterium]